MLVRTERRQGEEIYVRGHPSDALYVVGRGQVELRSTDEVGGERTMNTVGAGQVIGLTSFLGRTSHTTTARAASSVVLFELKHIAYDAIMASRPVDARSRPVASAPAQTALGE